MWLWIGVGVGSVIGLSLVVGLALAAVLGSIGREITHLHDELLEGEVWAVWPPSRARAETEERIAEAPARAGPGR